MPVDLFEALQYAGVALDHHDFAPAADQRLDQKPAQPPGS